MTVKGYYIDADGCREEVDLGDDHADFVLKEDYLRLRAALEWIADNGPDDAFELRERAREALKGEK